MIFTKQFYVLTCVVVNKNNGYIDQHQPIIFDTIEDAENFVMNNGHITFEHIDDRFIIWHSCYDDEQLYYTLWF